MSGVHNLSEYVKFHQEKLREQNARAASTSASASATTTTPPKKNSGVNTLSRKSEYDSAITNGEGVAVIDFFATWCGPCKMIAPTIVKFSEEMPQAKFYKVDVDQAPSIAQELGIRAMPTFVIFKDGQKVEEVVGANANLLKQKIQAVLQ